MQSHFLCNLEVHAPTGIIHIGMHGRNGHMMLYSLHHDALHIVLACDMRKLMEDERMMAHYQIAALLNGFVDDTLSNVKTQQCP